MRAPSITQFGYIYWAIIALGIVGLAVGWSETMASVQIQASVAQLGMGIVYVPIILGLAIQFVLLHFITRRASVVAKWIFVVVTSLGIVWSAFTLATRGAATPASGVIDVVLLVLQVIAITLLFRPDAVRWFGEDTTAA